MTSLVAVMFKAFQQKLYNTNFKVCCLQSVTYIYTYFSLNIFVQICTKKETQHC